MRAIAFVVVLLLATSAVGDDQAPASYVVVLDRSASMRGDKLQLVSSAVLDKLATFEPDDRVAVIAYGRTARVVSPLRAPDPRRLARELASIKTEVGDDVVAGLDSAGQLLAKVRGPRHVVVITDTASFETKVVRDAVAKLANFDISVAMVGVQIDAHAFALLGAVSTDAVDGLELLPRALTRAFQIPSLMNMAVAIVIDRSGSMQGPKLEAAKEAARVCVEVLSPNDRIAVVAFDTKASLVVGERYASNKMRISYEISRITSGGETNIAAGLQLAFDQLKPLANHIRHVIVISDGESPTDGITDLVDQMRAQRIVVTAVGLQGADRNLLSTIADHGDGRFYMVEDIGALPKILVRETWH
jgi:Mg-chelatase subunit ChlD